MFCSVKKSCPLLGAYESSIEEERRPQDPSVPWPICAYGFDIALENLAHIHCVNHSGGDGKSFNNREVILCITELPIFSFKIVTFVMFSLAFR